MAKVQLGNIQGGGQQVAPSVPTFTPEQLAAIAQVNPEIAAQFGFTSSPQPLAPGAVPTIPSPMAGQIPISMDAASPINTGERVTYQQPGASPIISSESQLDTSADRQLSEQASQSLFEQQQVEQQAAVLPRSLQGNVQRSKEMAQKEGTNPLEAQQKALMSAINTNRKRMSAQTQSDFRDAYKGVLDIGPAEQLYSSAYEVGEGVRGIKINAGTGIAGDKVDIATWAGQKLNATPVEVNNAAMNGFIGLMAQLKRVESEGGTEGSTEEDSALADISALAGGESVQSTRDSMGRATLDAGIVASALENSIRRNVVAAKSDVNNKHQTADTQGILGQAYLKSLVDSGYLEYTDAEVFTDKEKALVKKRLGEGDPGLSKLEARTQGVTITPRGMDFFQSMGKLAYDMPDVRGKAQVISGGTTGYTGQMGQYRKPGVQPNEVGVTRQVIGEGEGSYDAFNQMYNDYSNTPRIHSAEINKLDDIIQAALPTTEMFNEGDLKFLPPSARRNIDAGPILGPVLRKAAMAFNKISEGDMANPEDLKKAQNKIKNNARAIQAAGLIANAGKYVKAPVFYDPVSQRFYNDTRDANGQAYYSHRGSLEGTKSLIRGDTLKQVRAPANSNQAFHNGMIEKFAREVANPNGGISEHTKLMAEVWAIASLVNPNGANLSMVEQLKFFDQATWADTVRKGRAMSKFINSQKPNQEGSAWEAANPLTPEEEADVAAVIEETLRSKDDNKEHGLIVRAFTNAALLQETLDGGHAGVRITTPVGADMNSAGRLFLSSDAADDSSIATIQRLGFSAEATATNLYPDGDPRRFFVDTMKDQLAFNSSKFGLDVDKGEEMGRLLQKLSENVDGFDSDFAKGILMTTDYGKGLWFHTDSIKDKLWNSTVPGTAKTIRQSFADIFEVAPDSREFNEKMDNLLAGSLRTITSEWNASAPKEIAGVLAAFDRFAYTKGVTGNKVRTAYKEIRRSLAGDVGAVDAQGNALGFEAQEIQRLDNARKVSQKNSKLAESFKEFEAYEQVNSIGPALGQYREVETFALAHQETVKALGGSRYFENIHDNVIADPLYMAVFQQQIARTDDKGPLMRVIQNDLAVNLRTDFFKQVQDIMSDLKSVDTVYFGDQAVAGASTEFPGWTQSLDKEGVYLAKALQDTGKAIGKKAQRRFDMLFDANQKGIWFPADSITYRGKTIKPQQMTTNKHAVSSKDFQAWLTKWYFDKSDSESLISKTIKWSKSADKGSRKDSFVKKMKNARYPAFFKTGRGDKSSTL